MNNRTSGGRRTAAVTLIGACMTMIAACTSSESGGADRGSNTDTPPSSIDQVVAAPSGGSLRVDQFNDGVYCDGSERAAVIILDARPGETITFTSPMPITVADGMADDRGTYQMPWSCQTNEAGLTWEITAVGQQSQRSVTFDVNGSYEDPEANRTLVFTPSADAIVCDGTRQEVGRLDNAEPGESVTFTAVGATTDPLQPGGAGPDGSLPVFWTCRPEDGNADWRLQAQGRSSGRAVEFTITGRVPDPASTGPIQVEVIEQPFTCNRGRRPVATLRNLTPSISVAFEASPPNGPLRGGRADSSGALDVYWQCQRSEAGTTWELTATEEGAALAADSRRSITFVVTGAASDDPTSITVTEDPFACDGTTRPFAVLSGFLSREFIDFTSPQTDNIRQGQADANGELPIRWTCGADDVNTIWEVTATGATSGFSVAFTITGIAP